MNLDTYNKTSTDDSQSVLIVGDSGTAKTPSAVTYIREGDDRPVYVASLDGRIRSVGEWHRGEIAKRVEFDIYNDYESLSDKIDELVVSCPYQTLIVDPVTIMSVHLMRYSFGLRGTMEWDEKTGRATAGSKGKKKGKIDMSTFEDIGVEQRGIEDIIMNMKIIQKTHNTTIILVAHLLTTTYTKVGGAESHIRRDIVTAGKKVVAFIPTQFDEYYHFYCEGERKMCKTYNDGIVAARSSFTMMPKEIDFTDKNFFECVSKYYVPSERVVNNS